MAYATLKGLIDRPPTIETLFENEAVKIDRITVRGQITPESVCLVHPKNHIRE